MGNWPLKSKNYIKKANASFGSQLCGKWGPPGVCAQISTGTSSKHSQFDHAMPRMNSRKWGKDSGSGSVVSLEEPRVTE